MKLSINNVSKSFKSTKALTDFTVDFECGIYALLGPNGSGKSTLMNIITDNLAADSGTITYSGGNSQAEDVLKMGLRFREKLGYMPQYPGMYPNFTAERFMLYMAALKGLTKDEAARQIDEILSAVELDNEKHVKIRALSGGMKQRLALAQAVLGNPDVLILDEPTAGLDPKQRIAIRNYISKISFNKIVIIATHLVSDIEYVAKDVIMLKKGVIVDNAPPEELTRKIDGGVWNITCAESDVRDYQQKYQVINISNTDKGAVLRVLCDTEPTEATVTKAAPTLEDYYLHIFGDSAAV
jgi:ABC-type multidrug transport system, ATPase component